LVIGVVENRPIKEFARGAKIIFKLYVFNKHRCAITHFPVVVCNITMSALMPITS
jgi:hypothetical protein